MKKLEWNVYVENFNRREIEVYDIFSHQGFYKSLIKMKKDYKAFLKENAVDGNMEANSIKRYKKEVFTEKLRQELLYYFWGKCEWETVITSWPPYISREELNRLNTDNSKFALNVYLFVADKISAYDQVMLNFDTFVEYVWERLLSLKERK